jgi:hypothetical protein
MNKEVLDFYHKNKNFSYTQPKLLSNLNEIESARWLINNPNFAWLELDIDIPAVEVDVAEPYYVPHREGESYGWDSCCIHGIRTDATQNWPEYVDKEVDDTYKWTELSNMAPTATKFWKNLPYEKYKRVRYMKLQSNGYISPHSDMPGRGYIPGEPAAYDPLELGFPINVAVVHPENCFMVLEKFGIVPMVAGRAYLINIRHNHAVINFSNQTRIHMIGFALWDKAKMSELIVRSYERNCI